MVNIKQILNLLSHPGFRRYGVNTIWLFAEQVLRMVVTFLVGVWVARYLGPEKYGIFNYALAFVAIFGSVAKLGLDSIVVRELVKEPGKRNQYLGTSFWLKLIGGILTFIIIAIAIQFTNNDNLTNLFILIIAAGVIFQSSEVIDFYYQATVQAKYISIRRSIQLVISSLLKIYFIIIEADLIWFVLVTLFDAISMAVFGWCIYRMQGLPSFVKYFNINIAKNFLKDSWPLGVSGIVLMIQARIDQVMIKEMIGNTELGYYSAAFRLIDLLGFVPMIIYNSILPAIINAKKNSNELYRNRLLNYYRLSFFLFLIVAIPIFLFSERIVFILYGEAYQPAGALLSLMAIRLFFANLGVARSGFITVENLFSFSLLTMVIGTIINIMLNYFLIPIYHSQGAIISMIVSFFFTIFVIDCLYKKTRGNVKWQIIGILTFYKFKNGIYNVAR